MLPKSAGPAQSTDPPIWEHVFHKRSRPNYRSIPTSVCVCVCLYCLCVCVCVCVYLCGLVVAYPLDDVLCWCARALAQRFCLRPEVPDQPRRAAWHTQTADSCHVHHYCGPGRLMSGLHQLKPRHCRSTTDFSMPVSWHPGGDGRTGEDRREDPSIVG